MVDERTMESTEYGFIRDIRLRAKEKRQGRWEQKTDSKACEIEFGAPI